MNPSSQSGGLASRAIRLRLRRRRAGPGGAASRPSTARARHAAAPAPHSRAGPGRLSGLAGPGADAAPAGVLAQIAGPAAPRAGRLRGVAAASCARQSRHKCRCSCRRTGCPQARQHRGAQHAPAGLLLAGPAASRSPGMPPSRRPRGPCRSHRQQCSPADEADRGSAAGAVPLLLAHAAGRVTAAASTGRGPRPPSAGPAAGRAGAAGRATGVVSTSIRSLGVQSSAVHNAARVDSFTWAGSLVNSADTDADDSSRPAFSASSRRSWVPVHTSRWAAAIRSRHRIFMPPAPLRPARRASRTPHGDTRPR